MKRINDQALADARALIDSYISTGAISDLMGARPLLHDMTDAIDAHLAAAPTALVEDAANEVVNTNAPEIDYSTLSEARDIQIKLIELEHTGGYVYVELVHLSDGSILGIDEDCGVVRYCDAACWAQECERDTCSAQFYAVPRVYPANRATEGSD